MHLRNLLLLSFFVLNIILLNAQDTQKISCDLSSLYQITLSKSPTIQRQQIQNKRATADRQLATSIFDYTLFADLSLNRSDLNLLSGDQRRPLIGSHLKANTMALNGGVQRMFRSGLRVSSGLEYSRIADNLPLNTVGQEVGSFISNNNMTAFVSVAQPLWRGRGRSIVTANEKTTDIGIESQLHNAAFVTAGQVFNMALNYWQYVGANQAYEVYQSNEERVRKVLEITNELVGAEKKPAGDLVQIQADLKDKERQTILSEQQLFSARQNLGRSIGISTVESTSIGIPTNNFPDVESIGTTINLQKLLDIAYANRDDLKALKKSLEISSIYVDVAENNTKPQLDLTAFARYGSTELGNSISRFFSVLGQNEGRNYQVGVGLNYLFPVNNNRAEAELLTSQLIYSDQEINIQDQIRNIELNVSIAYNNLLNSIEAVKKSEQALRYYEDVFSNEQIKFQNGLTTLLNLILFQERLTFAQLDYIQNQQQFAIALSNLRYETGTIFSSEASNSQFDSAIFYALPEK